MRSCFRPRCRLLFLSALLLGSSLQWAQAQSVAPQSELNPLPSFESRILPKPTEVPGKEYSDNTDKDRLGNPDPGQVVHWQGDGTNVWDSFDYHVDTGGQQSWPTFETDALANIRDKYFLDLDGTRNQVLNPEDNQYYRDTVALVVSLQKKDGYTGTDGYQNNIYASRSALRNGGAELWADWKKNINATPGALVDLDGLELYGPDGTDDANMYSLLNDPALGGQERVSVFRYHPERTENQSVAYLNTQTLLNAVIKDGGAKPTWSQEDAAKFDVDGLMVWDVNDDDQFGDGDQVLFSIRPIEGLFDGGEIWLYKGGEDAAKFLVHGKYEDGTPRVWNTEHEVSMHFFGDQLHGENIDALEALVPEPSSLTLLILGGLTGVALLLRRR